MYFHNFSKTKKLKWWTFWWNILNFIKIYKKSYFLWRGPGIMHSPQFFGGSPVTACYNQISLTDLLHYCHGEKMCDILRNIDLKTKKGRHWEWHIVQLGPSFSYKSEVWTKAEPQLIPPTHTMWLFWVESIRKRC